MIPIAYSNKRPTGELQDLYFPSQVFLSRYEVIEIHHVCQGTSWSTLDLVFFTASVRTWHIQSSIHMSWQSWGTNMHKKEHQQIVRAPASIRPASPRNRKSSSAASTLSWQGPTLPGCLPSQQKSVCPKMLFQGHDLAPRSELPRNFQPQQPNCPGTWPFHPSIAVRQLHLLHLHGKPSRAGNPFRLHYNPRSE